MSEKMRIIRPDDPDFEKLMSEGKIVSGADVQALWYAWNAGEIPDPADGDEVVQPKSRPEDSSKENSSR
jgi:hypothetical protein